MKMEIVPPHPVLPQIVITLTGEEARKLVRVVGAFNTTTEEGIKLGSFANEFYQALMVRVA
jgi:hypothetical protein